MGSSQSHNKTSPDILDETNPNPIKKLKTKFVLGIIDPQYDLFEGGALGIPKSNRILAPINKLRFITWDYMEVFITQNSYPHNHVKFCTTHNSKPFEKSLVTFNYPDNTETTKLIEMLPPYCVYKTSGEKFHSHLIVLSDDKIFKKGTIKSVDTHSAFGDEFLGKYENTGLEKWLKSTRISDIVLTGIMSDLEILNTGIHAINIGYQVHIILSCVVGFSRDTFDNSINKLIKAGAKVYLTIEEFLEKRGHSLKLI